MIQERVEPQRMTSMIKVEVQSIWVCFDAHSIFLSVVLDNKLLKVQKRSLVLDFLPHLDYSLPLVNICRLALTHLALLVFDNELDDELLLQKSVHEYLFLDDEPDVDSA